MILQVPWIQFLEEVKAKIGPSTKIYLSYKEGQTIATASEPRLNFILRSTSTQSNPDILHDIAEADLQATSGEWLPFTDSEPISEISVAAVAYVSKEETPGLWCEVFPYKPDVSDVITRLISEFESEGALRNVTTEEFKKLAKPNVIILTQPEMKQLLQSFVREQKIEATQNNEGSENTSEPQQESDPV